ncbi:glycosyltransferase [Flexivirga meconopsidis]|uniref:glycosyltransferase n=1 Tax=Flexivirga meconopsidis TaxID=2977121 RepID=UPI00223F4371|nr:glycosyltransferase [Flexivirga meconopsidis]
MRRVTLARLATDNPMGAQVYQRQVADRAQAALRAHGSGADVIELPIRSMRSALPGRRAPVGPLHRASPALRRAAGRLLYGRSSLVHRMNLELPPHPAADVVTLHDLVAWEFADESAPVAAAAHELRAADAVICVSGYTAGRAVEVLGVRDPIVIPNGVDERFLDATPLTDQALATLGVRRPYVLISGGASERKNLRALAAAWPVIRDHHRDLTLVVAGPEHPARTALFAGMTGVQLTGRIPDDQMPGLVSAAAAVVVPSLVEGFGFPALEAMAANTPLVSSNTSSLPEVVGDGGTLVPPTAAGITEGLLHALADDGQVRAQVARGRQRADRFSWAASATQHARVWSRLLG